jgi:hypothetical protein
VIGEGRYFESTPTAEYYLHRDTNILVNRDQLRIVKFNFIFDSYGSEMRWYNTNEGYDGYVYKNTVNKHIRGYDINQCTEIFRTPTNEHCMLSGGVIHTLLNGQNNGINRRCYSYMMINHPWDEAVTRFSYFLE